VQKSLLTRALTGILCPFKSARALAERIIKCYENRDNLHSMGEKARDRILNDFNPKTAVDRTYNLYVDLLREKR